MNFFFSDLFSEHRVICSLLFLWIDLCKHFHIKESCKAVEGTHFKNPVPWLRFLNNEATHKCLVLTPARAILTQHHLYSNYKLLYLKLVIISFNTPTGSLLILNTKVALQAAITYLGTHIPSDTATFSCSLTGKHPLKKKSLCFLH